MGQKKQGGLMVRQGEWGRQRGRWEVGGVRHGPAAAVELWWVLADRAPGSASSCRFLCPSPNWGMLPQRAEVLGSCTWLGKVAGRDGGGGPAAWAAPSHEHQHVAPCLPGRLHSAAGHVLTHTPASTAGSRVSAPGWWGGGAVARGPRGAPGGVPTNTLWRKLSAQHGVFAAITCSSLYSAGLRRWSTAWQALAIARASQAIRAGGCAAPAAAGDGVVAVMGV